MTDETVLSYHLAQVNIGRLLAPLDSPQLAGFMAALDPVNAVADAAPGFVWRLQTEDGNATSVRAFESDEAGSAGVLVNMSVWESVEALAAFVYSGPHVAVLRQRRQWFEQMRESYSALCGCRRHPAEHRRRRGGDPPGCGPAARRRRRSPCASTSRRPASARPARAPRPTTGCVRPSGDPLSGDPAA